MSVNITLQGDKELIKKFRRMEKSSKIILNQELEMFADDFMQDAKSRLDAGGSAEKAPALNSFYKKKRTKKGFVSYEVGNFAYNAPFIEFGTRGKYKTPSDLIARKEATNFIGKKFFFSYVFRNVIRTMGYDKDHAQRVAASIGRKGNRPRPFFFPALQFQLREFEKRYNKIIRRIISS